MATTLLINSEQAFCFRPCSAASAFVMAPLVIALPPAFIDFMGGSMVFEVREGQRTRTGSLCKITRGRQDERQVHAACAD